MKTFIFNQKNGGANIILSAENYAQAIEELEEIVRYPYDWRVEDEDGEGEEEE